MLRVIVNGDDIGVFQARNQSGFALKAGMEVGVFQEGLVQYFNGYITVKRGMIAFVNRCHAALP